jgi:hypothetical protein
MTEAFSPDNPQLQLLWDATSLQAMVCPRKYQLAVLEGWRAQSRAQPGEEAGNDDIRFGTLLHSALERWDALVASVVWGLGPANMGFGMENAMLETLRCALVESRDWTSASNIKNRHTLVRAVVWYCLDNLSTRLLPVLRQDGRPFLETQLRRPLGPTLALIANIDGIKQWGGEVFAHERKSTKSYLGPSYWARFSLGPQVDTYDLVADAAWPEPVTGVLLEAVQTGVGFARWERRVLPRSPAKRAEWLKEVCRTVREAERCAMEFGPSPWPMRRSACNLDGGCPYRRVCSQEPRMRQAMLEHGFVRRPHDPLRPGGRAVGAADGKTDGEVK